MDPDKLTWKRMVHIVVMCLAMSLAACGGAGQDDGDQGEAGGQTGDAGDSPADEPSNRAPAITLLGGSPMMLNAGDTYAEPGAQGMDPEEGDISGDIVIDNSGVNTSVAGTYTVTYTLTDSDGAAADPVTRTVEVVGDDVDDGQAGSEGQWKAPIGVPVPAFGIEENHLMYEGRVFEAGGFTYKEAEDGPYSHYVDNQDDNCTDLNNPYGDAGTPRCNLPDSLPQGSVVEIHGVGFSRSTMGKSQFRLVSEGTAEQPVFIRGASNDERPTFVSDVVVVGEYLVIENLHLVNRTVAIPHTQNGISYHAKNISFRGNELEGDGRVGKGSAISVSTLNSGDFVENIVIYNNHIHRYGKHDHISENDYHGVLPGRNSKSVWIVDNHIHHNGGDSVQVHFYSVSPDSPPQYIYIARNDMHDDAENAVDLKGCLDVIVSENKMYNYDGFSGTIDSGTITVAHYDNPSSNVSRRVWYLFNEMFNAEGAANAVTSGPDEVYFVGNIIYDVTNASDNAPAFLSWGSFNIFVVNNTVTNVDQGVRFTGGDGEYKLSLENNIFSQLRTSRYVLLDNTSYRGRAIIQNNIFHSSSFLPSVDGDSQDEIGIDPLFQTVNGQAFTPTSTDPGLFQTSLSDVYAAFQSRYGIDIKVDYLAQDRPANVDNWHLGAIQ